MRLNGTNRVLRLDDSCTVDCVAVGAERSIFENPVPPSWMLGSRGTCFLNSLGEGAPREDSWDMENLRMNSCALLPKDEGRLELDEST